MAECIDRDALIKEIEADFNTDWNGYSKVFQNVNYVNGVRDEYDDILKIIREQPTIETIQQLENELAEAKRLLKLALEDVKRTDACFLCKYKDNYDTRCGVNEGCFVWRHADDIESFLNNKRVKEESR